jgi:hypothetical protein
MYASIQNVDAAKNLVVSKEKNQGLYFGKNEQKLLNWTKKNLRMNNYYKKFGFYVLNEY